MAIADALTSLYGGSEGTAGANAANAWEFFGEMMHSNILEEYYPKLLIHDQGQHITLPGHRGKTVHIRSWNKANPVGEMTMYDRDGAKTVSGVAGDEEWLVPEANQDVMSLEDYVGTIRAFGGYFPFTDIHMSISEVAETLSVGARQLGGGYAETVEDEGLKVLLETLGGPEVPITRGSGSTNWGSVTSSDYITLSDIYQVAIEFEADVDGMTYAFPDGYYHGIVHPYVKHDLMTNAAAASHALVDWVQTSRGQGMYEGGKVPVLNNVMLETSAFDTTDPYNSHAAFSQSGWPGGLGASGFNTGASGYLSLFFAPGAFSTLDLANATPSLILQPFGSGGATGDPLKRAMTIGIKGYQTWVPHQVNRRLQIMATATSLTP